jgi:glutamate dehydrogenase/leucine dehydrogenase
VNERLTEVMERSFMEVWRTSRLHEVTLRTAAYILAIGRVARAQELRGASV